MTMTTTTIDDRHHRRGDLVSGGASTIIRGPLLLPAARTDPSDKTERFLVLPTAPSSRRESSLLAPHNEKTDWIQWRVHEAGCRATPRSGRHALPAAPANSRLEPLEGGQKPLRFRRVLAALLQCRRRVAEHPKPGAGGRVLRLLDGQKVDSFHCCLGVLCRGARCGRTVRGPQGAQSARAAGTWGPVPSTPLPPAWSAASFYTLRTASAARRPSPAARYPTACPRTAPPAPGLSVPCGAGLSHWTHRL